MTEQPEQPAVDRCPWANCVLGNHEGQCVAASTLDLQLLQALASGEGGRRTGALKQAGLLEWQVTPLGHAALARHRATSLDLPDRIDDDPRHDGTEQAHPAWWRGYNNGVLELYTSAKQGIATVINLCKVVGEFADPDTRTVFLPIEEMLEALRAPSLDRRAIGVVVRKRPTAPHWITPVFADGQWCTFIGDLRVLWGRTNDAPDYDRPALADYGQTLRLGAYEISVELLRRNLHTGTL